MSFFLLDLNKILFDEELSPVNNRYYVREREGEAGVGVRGVPAHVPLLPWSPIPAEA